jgi:uroporphyrinogen III methyltransferase/synthase
MAGALLGKRVLITRAPAEAGRLRDALLAAGAHVHAVPAIQVVDPEDWAPLDQALGRLAAYDWLLFTSQNAVARVGARLPGGLPPDLRIAAVGASTARALQAAGLPVDLVPADARGEGLAEALRPHLRPGDRLLLPRGDLADDRLPNKLRALGCEPDEVIAYRTIPAAAPDPDLIAQFCQAGFDWVVLTSGSTVTGLLALLGGQRPQALAAGARIAVIGPETAKAAAAAGLTVDLIAPSPRAEALVAAMDGWTEDLHL